ncbi:Serine/threonine-protein phosphatase 2A regulatory subunit B'' subunit gamma [Glycine soja]|uniref:Serine/threonine-protein phosphatase 2A regulatory subunit B'' subunit gamma n=1 Tax=Glycine soja TaxID=3848 RepID=A0A0B2SMR8_GLYSO|nr:Serine/threonine-protein phosphatase 2A regulatory subunit B'' subunit gamma [Glycine soja]
MLFQKPEEGSINHRVQRLAKYRFLRKQSDLLLNADDLDAMWVCLRENCIIDDATGAEKMNYEDFCHIACVCTEQIGPKCRRFFSPSNFMKFEKDEQGRIAILPFYLYVMRTVSLTQARIDMSELDEDSDGFLQPHATNVEPGNELGKPVDINNAEDHIFGLVLLNDWSGSFQFNLSLSLLLRYGAQQVMLALFELYFAARDIQA